MKGSKTPDSAVVVSPSQKKLKQARLPFKIISDVSPASDTAQPRKRKLSSQGNDTATKIGKIAKENDVVDELVVLSDEESIVPESAEAAAKLPNPYVKLVNTAFKKRLLKNKTPKKRKTSKCKTETSVTESSADKEVEEVKNNGSEDMEVDDPCLVEESRREKSTQKINKQEEDTKDKEIINNNIEIIDLDSNNSCDVKMDAKTESVLENKVELQNDDEKPESTINETNNDQSESTDIETQTVKSNDDQENESNIKDNSLETIDIDNKSSGKTKESSEPSQDTDPPNTTLVTPKRSTRNKNKSLNTSTSLDESVTSAPSTPKQTKKASTNPGDDSMNDSTTSLTPKQLQKRLESAKKKEEREKEKVDREMKRQQEKEERDRVKREKEEQKKKEREEKEEAKKKEKEEKEEQKKKEREEKEKQKEMEKKLKEEKEEQKKKEKEEKEEQRRKEKEARDEEKRKKQEAIDQEKQEQELKKKKAAEAFANFFVPKQKSDKDQAVIGPVIKNNMLTSFTIKADMRLAPTVRTDFSDTRKKILDKCMGEQNVLKSYLKSLKSGEAKPECSSKTRPLDDKDDDVIIVEDELPPLDGVGEMISCESVVREKLRPKLLKFHENRRPPYWGTWRKKSAFIKARRPFGQDEKQLEYEVDSADEWEEDPEGESIDGSAAGSDNEAPDEYEVDNEVFVPHGYLSDEEATMDGDEDDVLALSPESQQMRLKYLEDEFELELKKPTEKLKPRLYGPIWETTDGSKPDKCADSLWNYFGKLAMIMDDPTPLLQPASEPEETEKKKIRKKKSTAEGEEASPKSEKKKKVKPESKDKKVEEKKINVLQVKRKSQLGINTFLTKLKST